MGLVPYGLLLLTLIMTVGSETTGTKTTCFAPPAYEGEAGSLTCHFGVDVAVTKKGFNVRRADRQGFDYNRDTILDCDWISGKLHCSKVEEGFKYDTTVSTRLTVIINNVTREHQGLYSCKYDQETGADIKSCNLTVSDRKVPVPGPEHNDGGRYEYSVTGLSTSTSKAHTEPLAAEQDESNTIVQIVVPVVIIGVVLIVAIVVAVVLVRRCRNRHPREGDLEDAVSVVKTEEEVKLVQPSSGDDEDDKKTDDKEKLVENGNPNDGHTENIEDDENPPPRPPRAHERGVTVSKMKEDGMGEPGTEDGKGDGSKGAEEDEKMRKNDKGEEGDNETSDMDSSSEEEELAKKVHEEMYKPVVREIDETYEAGIDILQPVPDEYKRASAKRDLKNRIQH